MTTTTPKRVLEEWLAAQANEQVGRERGKILDRAARLLDPQSTHDARTYPWLDTQASDIVRLREVYTEDYHFKPRTVRHQIQTVRSYLTRLHEAGLLPLERLTKIRKVRVSGGEALGYAGRRLEPEEIARVMSVHPDTPRKRFLRAAFFFLVTTGVRVSELLSLKREALEGVGRIDLVQKGQRAHRIWVTNPVREALRANWSDTPNSDLLIQWPSLENKQIVRQNLVREFKVLAKEAGIEPFTPHDLRRTVATTLLEQKHDPLIVSRILGHRKMETTAIYDRRPDDVKQEALEQMVEVIEDGRRKYQEPLRLVSQSTSTVPGDTRRPCPPDNLRGL